MLPAFSNHPTCCAVTVARQVWSWSRFHLAQVQHTFIHRHTSIHPMHDVVDWQHDDLGWCWMRAGVELGITQSVKKAEKLERNMREYRKIDFKPTWDSRWLAMCVVACLCTIITNESLSLQSQCHCEERSRWRGELVSQMMMRLRVLSLLPRHHCHQLCRGYSHTHTHTWPFTSIHTCVSVLRNKWKKIFSLSPLSLVDGWCTIS